MYPMYFERLRGNFTFTSAKVGPKGDPIFDDAIFDDVMTWSW